MRRQAAIAVLIAAAIAVLLPAGGAAGPKHPHHRHPHYRVFVNGDSLAVGTRPYLPADLRQFK